MPLSRLLSLYRDWASLPMTKADCIVLFYICVLCGVWLGLALRPLVEAVWP